MLEPGPDAIAWSLAIVATLGLSMAGLWSAEGLIRCRSQLAPATRTEDESRS